VYGIADWVQQRSEQLAALLNLKCTSMPHHSTYRRILSEVIDLEELEQAIEGYLSQLPRRGREVVIVIDGKSLRGTITAKDPFGLHLLAAYLPGEGIVLMQMEVEKEKENEITVAPKLLKSLDLRQKIVIGDAMHAQRKISTQIVEAGGDYVWTVKDNQAKTRQAIEKLFSSEKPIPGTGTPAMDFRTAQTVTKQAGRLEQRSITVSCMLNDYLIWPYVGQVFKLERRFTDLHTGEINVNVVYGLTSLTAQSVTPDQLMKIIRSQWGIENGLHYRRDVTYQEDQTRMTNKNMGRVMAIINNLLISLLNNHGFANHARARRIMDASPWKALALIGGL
jgi:predicted transposase YbfD/YdcC